MQRLADEHRAERVGDHGDREEREPPRAFVEVGQHRRDALGRNVLHHVAADDGVVDFGEIVRVPQAADRQHAVLHWPEARVETFVRDVETVDVKLARIFVHQPPHQLPRTATRVEDRPHAVLAQLLDEADLFDRGAPGENRR